MVVMGHRRPESEEIAERFELVQNAGIPVLYDAWQAIHAIAKLSWYQRKVKRGRRVDTEYHACRHPSRDLAVWPGNLAPQCGQRAPLRAVSMPRHGTQPPLPE